MPPNNIRLSRVARALIVAGLTLIVAAGCVKVDLNVTISENNTVSSEYIVAVSEAVMADLSDFGDSADPFDSTSPLFDGKGTAEEYREEIDGEVYVGKRYVATDISIDEVNASIGGTSNGLSITRSGDDFVVVFVMANEDVEALPGLSAELAEEITFTFSVTFPGSVSESNGELSNGGRTVTWNIDLTRNNELRAVGSATSSIPTWMWLTIAGGILGIVVIAGIVVVMARRRPMVAAPAMPADTFTDHPPQPGPPVGVDGAPVDTHDAPEPPR